MSSLGNRWLYNCLHATGRENTPNRILSMLKVLNGKWKLPSMTVTERIDEEFAIFADETVFIFDGLESSGIDGKWRVE